MTAWDAQGPQVTVKLSTNDVRVPFAFTVTWSVMCNRKLGAEPLLTQRADGSIIADARTPIAEFEQRFGVKLLPPTSEEEVDSLGGLVFTLAGRVPSRGETIEHPSGIEFDVLDADPRRVKRLRVRGVPIRQASDGATR